MNRSIQRIILAAAIGGAMFVPGRQLLLAANPSPAVAPASAVTDVPVKEVVLYSSGVGYFEHFGAVTGDASTTLSFKSTQINDILKSLLLEDTGGGKISTITYASQDPLAKTLKSFQVDITSNPSLAALLDQLRGARVKAHLGGDELIEGTIVGVETRQDPAPPGQVPVKAPVLNILTDATIRQIELRSVSGITLEDPNLQDELNKALVALAQARDQDRRPVTINFNGKGTRGVRIGYVISTPIWKTSYRLILSRDPKEKPMLQGWAIVENQTDNDWKDVELSLVSGRPISFVQDLYQPLYIPRPIVQPELYASLRPQMDTGGSPVRGSPSDANDAILLPRDHDTERARADASAGAAPMQQNSAGQNFYPNAKRLAEAASPAQQAMNPNSSIASIASAASMGELFQYTVGNVSLSRQKSAMLPIVTDPVGIDRVSVYNANVLPRNPLNGVRLKNTTGKHLLTGPVTVLDAGSYAGDAEIDNLPPGQQRLLTYGVDLQATVETEYKQPPDVPIRSAKITNGVLEVQRRFVSTQSYTATNKSDHDKTIIIEHPKRDGWALYESDKPIETTDSVYRFQFPVTANKSAKLAVNEESVQDQTIAILPTDVDTIAFYYEKGGDKIPKEVHDAVGKALDMKRGIADTQRDLQEHDQQIAQITQDQSRIRENMRTVEHNSAYYQRLLSKLNSQEDSLEKLHQERDELAGKSAQQQKDLSDYLANLNV